MHVGLLVLKADKMTDDTSVTVNRALLVGTTTPGVCALCTKRKDGSTAGADPGCHPKLSSKSYNQKSPWGPSVGMIGSVHALSFTAGPGVCTGMRMWAGLTVFTVGDLHQLWMQGDALRLVCAIALLSAALCGRSRAPHYQEAHG